MSTATMTNKGRVTIPAAVRAALGVEAGYRLEFVQVEPGRFEMVAATQSVSALKSLIRRPSEPVLIDQMNEAIVSQGSQAK